MQRHRGILATLALFALVVGGTGVGSYFSFFHLPHPRHASTRQLLRWMVQRNLASEPLEIQLALADRFELELQSDLGVEDAAANLDSDQLERLQENFEQLKFVWFVSRTNRYFDLPPDQRFSFLQEQLQTIHNLADLHLEIQPDASPDHIMAEFFDDIESWIVQATGVQEERMISVVKAASVCWLANYDLAEQPPDVQVAIVDRLQDTLSESATVDATDLPLDSRQQRILSRNVDLLLKVWFTTRSQQYPLHGAATRMEFLQTQFKLIDRWASVRLPSSNPSSAATVSKSPAGRFFDQVESWIDQSNGAVRANMQQAVHDGVVCWLATGDMQTQTMETRRELATRIAAALDDERTAVEQGNALSQQQRATLRGNAVLLFEAWFQDRAREYQSIPVVQRDAFVAAQIQRVTQWGILEFLIQADGSSETPSNFAKLIGLTKLANRWIERASEEDRLAMRQLFTDVQRQLLSGNAPRP